MNTPTATIFLPYHALDDVIQRGTRAAQPDAADVVPGTLYGVTDEGDVVERSNGAAWEAYSPTGSGGGAPSAHHLTHEDGGSDEVLLAQSQVTGLTTALSGKVDTTDPRLSDARTPTLHHTSHEPGGTDALTALSASILTSGTLPVARLGAGTTTVVTNTDTGTVTNWAPGIAGDTVIFWNGASALTVNSLAGGVPGQVVTIRNVNASGVSVFVSAYNSTVSGFLNYVTSGPTPLGFNGSAVYQYQAATGWRLIAHEQGAGISASFNAANFTANAATWTVEAGDVLTLRYVLQGRLLTVLINVTPTSVNVATSNLFLSNGAYGGYHWAFNLQMRLGLLYDNNVLTSGYVQGLPANPTTLYIYRDSGNFSASTNGTQVTGIFVNEVQ